MFLVCIGICLLCFAACVLKAAGVERWAGRTFTTPTPHCQPNGVCIEGPGPLCHHHTQNGRLWRTLHASLPPRDPMERSQCIWTIRLLQGGSCKRLPQKYGALRASNHSHEQLGCSESLHQPRDGATPTPLLQGPARKSSSRAIVRFPSQHGSLAIAAWAGAARGSCDR